MTGSIDLTPKQVASLAKYAEQTPGGGWPFEYVARLSVHSVDGDGILLPDHAVRVVRSSISFGDVVRSHCYILITGERLTGREYRNRPGLT